MGPPHVGGAVVSLDVFASLAAIAAAIGIAYGSLPDFRHRRSLVEYVKSKLASHEITRLLTTNPGLKNYEAWGVLYRLGNLKEDAKYPIPGPQSGGQRLAVDNNFAKRRDVRRYNWLFISNLDKSLGIALGSLAVTIIWFGVLDRLSFPEPVDGNSARLFFLCGVSAFILLTLSFCFVAALLHYFLCSTEPKPSGWRKGLVRGWNTFSVIVFILLVLWSLPNRFAFDHSLQNLVYYVSTSIGWDEERLVYDLIKVVLLATILLPLLLLWYGDRLSQKMQGEADQAIDIIKGGAAEAVGRATLRAN
jgi:hypothetical protein